MLKVSALFLCVISCLVFHCDDSQGDSAVDGRASPSYNFTDNATLTESIKEATVSGDRQSTSDSRGDDDMAKKTLPGPGKTDGDTVNRDLIGPGVKKDLRGPGVKKELRGPGVKEERKGPGEKEEQKGPVLKEEREGPKKADGGRVKRELRGPGVKEGQKGLGVKEEKQGPGVKVEKLGPGVKVEKLGPGVKEELKGPEVKEEKQGPGVKVEKLGPGLKENLKVPGVKEELRGPGVKEELIGPGMKEELRGPGVKEELRGPGKTADDRMVDGLQDTERADNAKTADELHWSEDNTEGGTVLEASHVTPDPGFYTENRPCLSSESPIKVANHNEVIPLDGAIVTPRNADASSEENSNNILDDGKQVVSSPEDALKEGETKPTPTGPTTPGTPIDQIDTPPTIVTPENQDQSQLPGDTPEQPSGDNTQASEKESDTEVGETEGNQKDEEGGIDSPGLTMGDKEDTEVAGDVQGEGDGKTEGEGRPEGDQEQPDPGVHKVEDMPSFEEWKRQMFDKQQAELVEKTKQQMGAQHAAPGGTAQTKPKSLVNYAKASCGAKIIAANPEATNPGFILSENKDQYMINPCNVKKWFVVELCEPIQIENLELGNLELFSSQPESFVVSVSGRFPTNDWKELGTLHAREERAVQSFPMFDHLFAKYLRLEMKSHYGREHYCPLTVLRAFGTTVLEDDSDEFAYSPEDATGPDDSETIANQDKASNLFTTATDTVLSLVRTVLSPGEQEQNSSSGDPRLDDVLKLDMVTKNTSETEEKIQLNDTVLCTPHNRALAVGFESHTAGDAVFFECNRCKSKHGENVCSFDICAFFNVSNITWPVSCARSIEGPRRKNDTIMSDTLDGTTIDKNLSHNAMIGQNDIAPKVAPKRIIPDMNEKETKFDGRTSEKLIAAPPSENVAPQRSDVTGDSPSDVADKIPSLSELKHVASSDLAIIATSVAVGLSLSATLTVDNVGKLTDTPSISDVSTGTLESSMGTVSQADIKLTATVPIASQPTKLSSHEPTPTELGSSMTSNDDTKAPLIPPVSVTDSTPKLQPDAPNKVTSAGQDNPVKDDSQLTLDTNNTEERTVKIETAENNVIVATPETTSNASVGTKRDIYADLPSDSATESMDAPLPPTETSGEEVAVNRLAKKEMTYMRLKNRIKTLEVNLNLSSSYLEQLSQRYKLYMDNMYHYLNQTISNLANTTKSAEARDLKQQEHIALLQKQINKLTATITALSDNTDQLHKQVIERHLFLMLLEAIVFVCIITWCISRQRITAPVPKSSVPAPVSPSRRGTPSHMKHRRYKSVDVTPNRQKLCLAPASQDDLRLHKSECDSMLTIISQDIPLFITSNSAIKRSHESSAPVHNRKKKKKVGGCQKQLWRRDSNQSVGCRDSEFDSLSTHTTSKTSCATRSDRTSDMTSSGALLSADSTPDTSNSLIDTGPSHGPIRVASIGASESYVDTLEGDIVRRSSSDRLYSLLNNLKTKWNTHMAATGGSNTYGSIIRDSPMANSKGVHMCKEHG